MSTLDHLLMALEDLAMRWRRSAEANTDIRQPIQTERVEGIRMGRTQSYHECASDLLALLEKYQRDKVGAGE